MAPKPNRSEPRTKARQGRVLDLSPALLATPSMSGRRLSSKWYGADLFHDRFASPNEGQPTNPDVVALNRTRAFVQHVPWRLDDFIIQEMLGNERPANQLALTFT